MSICIISQNQPIYQALLDKAASYPADKFYQTKAYQKAAESVSKWNYNLYNDYIPSIPGVGISIENFIYDFTKANPEQKPNSMWEQLKEMVTPELYTAEKPRRSPRIASKTPTTKSRVTKPIVTKSIAKYFPEEKKASTAVPIIRTYGVDDDGYTTTGYALYRANGKFEIINVGHCSCFDTVEILEGYDEDEYENTLAHIVCLSTSKSDPRVPDVVTEDPHLLALYASILEHKDVLETWNPEELDEHLDMIEVHDPEFNHRR
jgi:hypothetical protein